MRIQRLDVTDLVAGLLVAAATTIYAAGAAGADLPGLDGVRARACAVFLFGMLAFGVGARRDAFEGPTAGGPFSVALSAIGVLTLVVGITAIILASAGYLAALMIGIGLLWVGATLRHLVAPVTSVVSEVHPRELVKR